MNLPKRDEGTEFQTRSGMSSAGCHAGVPCPGDTPKAVPVPPNVEIQNAYLITNGGLGLVGWLGVWLVSGLVGCA